MAAFKEDDKNAVDEQNETMWLIFPYDVFDYDSSPVSNSFLCEVKNRERALHLAQLIKYDYLGSSENMWKRKYP